MPSYSLSSTQARAVLLFSLVAAAGCSSTTTTGTPDNGTDAGTTPGTDAGAASDSSVPAPPGSYTLTFGPVQVAPSIEKTQCVVKRLGNTIPLHVGTFHNVLGDASHHMIVYRVNDTVEQTTPFDCKPFTDTLDPAKGSPVMISQKRDDTLTLPTGVAYTLDANQMVRLEMHYINPGSNAVTLTSTSTMIPIADADFKDEADFLFIGNPDMVLNPLSTATLGPTYFALPSSYAGANFYAITGHEHQMGTNVVIEAVASKTDTAGTSVYNVPNWSWSEPKTVFAPFSVPAGGGFRFTCSWNNTSTKQIKFGESADKEMCFFWAYYYPSKPGAKVCAHTDKITGGADFCCPGSPVCAYLQ